MKKIIAVTTTALLATAIAVTGAWGAAADETPEPATTQVKELATAEIETVEPVTALKQKAETTQTKRAPRPPATKQPVTPVTPVTIKVFWELPEGMTGSSPFADIWPQTYLGTSAADLQCGYTAQWDIYLYTTAADIAAVDALWADGILSAGPEDQGLHPTADGSSWGFVYGGDCPPPVVVPEEPDTTVTHTEWVEGLPDCELETVTSTRTTTTTTYALVDNVWVPTSTDVVESTERATTDAECPTAVVPPVVPPVVTPPVVDPPTSVTPTDSLAYTGATADGGLIAGTVLFGLGVLAMIGAAYRRAHSK